VVLIAVGAGGAYLAYRMTVGLQYRWNWGMIPQYLFRYDAARGGWTPNLLMQGFFTTIRLSVWTTVLGTLLGAIMGLFRISDSLYQRMVGRTYVEIARNLPPLVLIFLFYFFFSDQLMTALNVDGWVRNLAPASKQVVGWLFAPPARFSAFVSALLTLAVYEGAYITEIVRAGIQSIERGQWEASAALGLSWGQQMRHIILPQSVQRILPALGGQFISTIKDSAIVSVISIQELTFQGTELMAATYRPIEVWITVTALYFVLTFSCSLAVGRLEYSLHRRRA
jgi:polar amino acid transport system permease protein